MQVSHENKRLKSNIKAINGKAEAVLKKSVQDYPVQLFQLSMPFKTLMESAITQTKEEIRQRNEKSVANARFGLRTPPPGS